LHVDDKHNNKKYPKKLMISNALSEKREWFLSISVFYTINSTRSRFT